MKSPIERLSAVDLFNKAIVRAPLFLAAKINRRWRMCSAGAVIQTRNSASENGDLML
jgi:hypothetical protein